jgi:hypothetical protein
MSTVRKRLEDVVVREVECELLVLDEARSRIHKLNTTASLIWTRCDTSTPSEIAAELAAAYDVGPEQALMDVMNTLMKLKALSLVE